MAYTKKAVVVFGVAVLAALVLPAQGLLALASAGAALGLRRVQARGLTPARATVQGLGPDQTRTRTQAPAAQARTQAPTMETEGPARGRTRAPTPALTRGPAPVRTMALVTENCFTGRPHAI
jgi:hypothetical protein